MAGLRAIRSELFGLFVDDVAFAASILAWLFAMWLLLPRLPALFAALLLPAGLLAILITDTLRSARAARGPRTHP